MKAMGKIGVVSLEVAEQAEFLCCMRDGMPSPFTDNDRGTCAHCGHGIFFRPNVPKNPTKICVQCAFDLAVGGRG